MGINKVESLTPPKSSEPSKPVIVENVNPVKKGLLKTYYGLSTGSAWRRNTIKVGPYEWSTFRTRLARDGERSKVEKWLKPWTNDCHYNSKYTKKENLLFSEQRKNIFGKRKARHRCFADETEFEPTKSLEGYRPETSIGDKVLGKGSGLLNDLMYKPFAEVYGSLSENIKSKQQKNPIENGLIKREIVPDDKKEDDENIDTESSNLLNASFSVKNEGNKLPIQLSRSSISKDLKSNSSESIGSVLLEKNRSILNKRNNLTKLKEEYSEIRRHRRWGARYFGSFGFERTSQKQEAIKKAEKELEVLEDEIDSLFSSLDNKEGILEQNTIILLLDLNFPELNIWESFNENSVLNERVEELEKNIKDKEDILRNKLRLKIDENNIKIKNRLIEYRKYIHDEGRFETKHTLNKLTKDVDELENNVKAGKNELRKILWKDIANLRNQMKLTENSSMEKNKINNIYIKQIEMKKKDLADINLIGQFYEALLSKDEEKEEKAVPFEKNKESVKPENIEKIIYPSKSSENDSVSPGSQRLRIFLENLGEKDNKSKEDSENKEISPNSFSENNDKQLENDSLSSEISGDDKISKKDESDKKELIILKILTELKIVNQKLLNRNLPPYDFVKLIRFISDEIMSKNQSQEVNHDHDLNRLEQMLAFVAGLNDASSLLLLLKNDKLDKAHHSLLGQRSGLDEDWQDTDREFEARQLAREASKSVWSWKVNSNLEKALKPFSGGVLTSACDSLSNWCGKFKTGTHKALRHKKFATSLVGIRINGYFSKALRNRYCKQRDSELHTDQKKGYLDSDMVLANYKIAQDQLFSYRSSKLSSKKPENLNKGTSKESENLKIVTNRVEIGGPENPISSEVSLKGNRPDFPIARQRTNSKPEGQLQRSTVYSRYTSEGQVKSINSEKRSGVLGTDYVLGSWQLKSLLNDKNVSRFDQLTFGQKEKVEEFVIKKMHNFKTLKSYGKALVAIKKSTKLFDARVAKYGFVAQGDFSAGARLCTWMTKGLQFITGDSKNYTLENLDDLPKSQNSDPFGIKRTNRDGNSSNLILSSNKDKSLGKNDDSQALKLSSQKMDNASKSLSDKLNDRVKLINQSFELENKNKELDDDIKKQKKKLKNKDVEDGRCKIKEEVKALKETIKKHNKEIKKCQEKIDVVEKQIGKETEKYLGMVEIYRDKLKAYYHLDKLDLVIRLLIAHHRELGLRPCDYDPSLYLEECKHLLQDKFGLKGNDLGDVLPLLKAQLVKKMNKYVVDQWEKDLNLLVRKKQKEERQNRLNKNKNKVLDTSTIEDYFSDSNKSNSTQQVLKNEVLSNDYIHLGDDDEVPKNQKTHGNYMRLKGNDNDNSSEPIPLKIDDNSSELETLKRPEAKPTKKVTVETTEEMKKILDDQRKLSLLGQLLGQIRDRPKDGSMFLYYSSSKGWQVSFEGTPTFLGTVDLTGSVGYVGKNQTEIKAVVGKDGALKMHIYYSAKSNSYSLGAKAKFLKFLGVGLSGEYGKVTLDGVELTIKDPKEVPTLLYNLLVSGDIDKVMPILDKEDSVRVFQQIQSSVSGSVNASVGVDGLLSRFNFNKSSLSAPSSSSGPIAAAQSINFGCKVEGSCVTFVKDKYYDKYDPETKSTKTTRSILAKFDVRRSIGGHITGSIEEDVVVAKTSLLTAKGEVDFVNVNKMYEWSSVTGTEGIHEGGNGHYDSSSMGFVMWWGGSDILSGFKAVSRIMGCKRYFDQLMNDPEYKKARHKLNVLISRRSGNDFLKVGLTLKPEVLRKANALRSRAISLSDPSLATSERLKEAKQLRKKADKLVKDPKNMYVTNWDIAQTDEWAGSEKIGLDVGLPVVLPMFSANAVSGKLVATGWGEFSVICSVPHMTDTEYDAKERALQKQKKSVSSNIPKTLKTNEVIKKPLPIGTDFDLILDPGLLPEKFGNFLEEQNVELSNNSEINNSGNPITVRHLGNPQEESSVNTDSVNTPKEELKPIHRSESIVTKDDESKTLAPPNNLNTLRRLSLELPRPQVNPNKDEPTPPHDSLPSNDSDTLTFSFNGGGSELRGPDRRNNDLTRTLLSSREKIPMRPQKPRKPKTQASFINDFLEALPLSSESKNKLKPQLEILTYLVNEEMPLTDLPKGLRTEVLTPPSPKEELLACTQALADFFVCLQPQLANLPQKELNDATKGLRRKFFPKVLETRKVLETKKRLESRQGPKVQVTKTSWKEDETKLRDEFRQYIGKF